MAKTSREIEREFKSTGRQALEAGKSLYGDAKSEIKSQLKGTASDLRSELGERYDALKHNAQEAYNTSEKFVRDRPITSILGACAIGFVAGLIARRNRH